jgi:ribosomal protein S18 acetylase RimI-like enzyme
MSDSVRIRLATPSDLDALLPLMRGYYRDDGLEFDERHARATLGRLLAEPQWGGVLIAESDSAAIGYIALCIGFSLELGGNDAFLDELFVAKAQRGRGVARLLLDALEAYASERGVRAVHLEVDKDNTGAQRIYNARRYRPRDRYHLLTKVLA